VADEWSSSADDSHLVAGDIAVSDRQLDLTIASVRDVACALGSVELVDVGDEPGVAEVLHLCRYELGSPSSSACSVSAPAGFSRR
jgi:hypothetical protein